MPQNFVSRYNNLLAVKGRDGIEYTAGPNIDISDYIISGRDWTSDINAAIEGVKGSSFDATTAWVDSQGYLTEHQDVSNLPYVQNSALEFSPQNLISGISGTGLYATSADAAFLAETANFAYHSESADTAGYAESAGITDSANYALTAFFANSATSSLMADTAIYAYTADKADDLTNWTYTDSAMTGIKGYNGTAFISQDLQYWDYTDSAHTAIKGYNGTAFNSIDANCPWISGNKIISPTQETYAGQEFQVISSFDFSGNKNHFISLKGMVLKFPSTAHIASALGDKFDTTSFNSFITNGFNPNMNELHGATAYLSAFVNTGCVHNSALDYTEDEKISGISGIPLVGNGGGEAIWISGNKYIGPEVLLNFGDAVQYISSFTVSGDHNHAIALKGSQFKLPSTAHIQSALDEKLPISSFSSYTSYADGRMDSIFQLANSAYTTAVNNFYNKADLSAISSWSGDINYISGEFTAFTATATGLAVEYSAGDNIDITNHVVSGKDWLPTIESGLSSKLDSTAFTAFTATADFVNSGDVTGTAQWALTTGGWQKITGGETGGYELSAGPGISITDYPDAQKTVIAVTGSTGTGESYAAGQYIDINASNIISVTGLQPSGNYQTAGNYVSSTTFNNYTATADAAAYTAGSNINITNHVVSGKDWTDTITAASAYAATMATGKEYLGVAPIVVNNTTDQISAQTMELIAGNGIEFVTAATSTTINCTAAGGGGASVHYYIDTPNEHTSADIELTIQTSANIGGRYDRWLMNSGNFIGALIPSSDSLNDANKVLTVTAGSPRWMPLPETPSGALGIKVLAVATSAAATAGDANTLYIVTGS